jgi:hypothetical protein
MIYPLCMLRNPFRRPKQKTREQTSRHENPVFSQIAAAMSGSDPAMLRHLQRDRHSTRLPLAFGIAPPNAAGYNFTLPFPRIPTRAKQPSAGASGTGTQPSSGREASRVALRLAIAVQTTRSPVTEGILLYPSPRPR